MNSRNAELLGLEQIRIFEIGKVFNKEGDGKTLETLKLCIGISLVKKVKGKKAEDILKEIVENIKNKLGIVISENIISAEGNALIEIDFGKIISSLKAPESYSDIKIGKVDRIEYKKFSPYPYIVRDIAVFVSDDIKAEEVWNVILNGIKTSNAEGLVVRKSLFDVFTKKMEDGTNKTSYAYRIVFQSFEKTLSDAEINDIMQKINSMISGKGWVVR